MLHFHVFFFFSSRRRHTRYWRDWSSDVCSSDLVGIGSLLGGGAGADSSSLTDDGGVSQATIADGDYWRLVTAGFLHAGPFHLLTNMLALWILGTMIEPALGKWRFALVYFVSLLCGSFGALLLSPDGLTVGASGAVFGLMAA